MAHSHGRAAQFLLFALVLVAASIPLDRGGLVVTQAVVWLPTGVAIAGVWRLGLRAWWLVALGTVAHRWALAYSPSVIVSATIGSSAEAVLGALVLRWLDVRPDLGRLRDVLSLFVAAGIAPLASIGASMIGYRLTGALLGTGLDSWLWGGWWRMNALGALLVVPPAMTWLTRPTPKVSARNVIEAAAIGTAVAMLIWLVMIMLSPGPTAIMLLFMVLPVALYAAIRFGARGATAVAALGGFLVAMMSLGGVGSFVAVDPGERHVVIQLFEFTLVGVPLVLGGLIAERKASATGWRASEGHRQALLQILPDITYHLSSDGRVFGVFAPPGLTLPYPREQIVGRKITEFSPPDVAERLLASIAAAHDGVPSGPVEYRLETKDGARMREARCVRLGDGEVLGVVRDITERKHGERLLSWQAEILELIATGRPVPHVFEALVRGIEALSDEGRCSILQLQGRRLHVAWAPSLPAAYRAAIEGLEIGPKSGSCGTAAHHNRAVLVTDIAADPLWVPYASLALAHGLRACWAVPVRSASGAVLGTFSTYYAQPRAPAPAEIALVERAAALAGFAMDRERREDLLASISRNVNEGLFRTAPDRGLVYVNQAFARMFGYQSAEEMLTITWSTPHGCPEHQRDIQRLIAGHGTSTNQEVRLHRQDASTFWGLLSVAAVAAADGGSTFYDGVVSDITARKELEEQLRQAQKMEAVGKLAGGVAHDFNNLLMVIRGCAESMRETAPAAGLLQSQADEVITAVDRAAGLTRQLLAFSRQQVLSPQVIDLAAVVEHLADMLRRLIGEDIRLVVQRGPQATCARVDRSQLEQVILNLVVNARDAMPNGGTLTIATNVVEVSTAVARPHVDLVLGRHVVLSVQDSGIGMSQEVRARAFDPFFTTKEPGKGTGLGLSTVYGIVKQSGGAVWIDSSAGAGTTMWVCLPRVDESAAVGGPVISDIGSAAPTTLLLVEDERLVRELVQGTLQRAGHVVLAADSGESALALAANHAGDIDLLITDVVMPRLGGRELAGRLTAQRPKLQVLFMSGYANDDLHRQGHVLDPRDFLQKPFAGAQLLERVNTLLARAT